MKTMSDLHLSSVLIVYMTLVDEKVIGEHVERDARHIHLIQARCFVSAVADEALIAPVSD